MPARDIALLLLVVVAWAINFLTSALSLREIPPFLFTALRFALLAVPLVFVVKRPAPGQWPRLIAVCLCIGVLHFGLSFSALKAAGDLSSPAIVLQSYVPMTALLAWWLLGERFAWRTGVAIAISFGLDVYSQQGWTALIAVPPLLAISLVVEPGGLSTLGVVSWVGWMGVAYAAFVSSLLGHGLYYLLVQRHPVAQVTPWLLLVPVIAIALGIVFWGDRPGPSLWIGGAMVLGGVLLIALRNLAKARAQRALAAEL
ncbi:MAG: EamA family transporter [Lysobacter sp.]|nr:EamA family transporter [Lysobacter sp.]